MRPRTEFARGFLLSAITFAALLVLCVSVSLSAQMVGATVSGTVVDASGGVVPNVTVVAKNAATGSSATAVTNGVGVFNAPNLPPGNYEITASAPGFETQVRKDVTLTVGQELVLNMTLKVGNTSQTIEVSTEAPSVDLANATVGGLINETTVETLPLNGRSWSDLAVLSTGVHQVLNQPTLSASADRTKRGMGVELTVAGGRPQANNYLVDGVNINNYTDAGPGSLLGGQLGTDAVAEFTVLTTNQTADYGRTSGGVISAITKSGTNQFHGSAYEFLRNDKLDASNFIDDINSQPKPPFRRNQFGGSAGGPIQKNKTFIFGDYEGVRQSLSSTVVSTVPSAADMAAAIAELPMLTPPVTTGPDPNALLYLKTFIPSSPTGTFTFQGHTLTTENFFITRADHVFSDKDRIFGTFLYDNSHQSEPDEYENKLVENQSKRMTIATEWTHVFNPELLNSFRLGFNRDHTASPIGGIAINPAIADPKFAFVPGNCQNGPCTVGAINIDPYMSSTGNGFFSGGLSSVEEFSFLWNSYQIYDDISVTKGKHTMKLGGNAERIQEKLVFGGEGGSWSFNSLAEFLGNQPATFDSITPNTQTPRYVRSAIAAGYFQDDFHFRSNLTFNFGLRYEIAQMPYEKDGKIANLRIDFLNSKVPPNPFLGSPYWYNPTLNDWEPRIGFAWDPFKNGKSSVRAGFGMFDVLPMPHNLGSGIDSTAPFVQTFSVDSPGAENGNFPSNGFAATNVATPGYYSSDAHPKRPLVMQWNLSLERQLTPSTTFMIGYVGARGVHEWVQANSTNTIPFTINSSGNLEWPCPQGFSPFATPEGTTIQLCNGFAGEGQSSRPNPFVGRVGFAQWSGWYNYDALQVQVRKMMSHGFQITGNYTWSKNMDVGSGAVASDQYLNSVTGLLWNCVSCRRSVSDTDVPNNITVDALWNIPTAASFNAPLKAILGNWQTGGILTLENGRPFTVLLSGDPLNGLKIQQHPDRIFGGSCANPVNPGNAEDYIKLQCFTPPNPSTQYGDAGRNTLRGPGLASLDFSLYKDIPIKKILESSNIQFRFECFNCTNRVNLSPPVDHNTIMNNKGTVVNLAGLIDGTSTTSRQIQLALKLTW